MVAAALLDAEGRVLVQQRPPGSAMAGLWEFPGGKVEPGETPENALVRELEEELGIIVAPDAATPLAFASAALADRHLVLLLYLIGTWSGSVRPLQATGLRWATVAELADLAMPPADTPLVEALARYLASGARPAIVIQPNVS